VLEVDGVQLGQSYAILMYAGRLAKLVPEDALQAAKARATRSCEVALRLLLCADALPACLQVEEVLFHLIDLDTLLAPSGKEADAAKKASLREALAAGPLLSWFAAIEARLCCACVRRPAVIGADALRRVTAARAGGEQERLARRRRADGGGPGRVRPRAVL
jgi:hypothetical protein